MEASYSSRIMVLKGADTPMYWIDMKSWYSDVFSCWLSLNTGWFSDLWIKASFAGCTCWFFELSRKSVWFFGCTNQSNHTLSRLSHVWSYQLFRVKDFEPYQECTRQGAGTRSLGGLDLGKFLQQRWQNYQNCWNKIPQLFFDNVQFCEIEFLIFVRYISR